MNENERYVKLFDTIGTDTEITVDSLTARRREKKAASFKKAACTFAAFAVFFLGSNMISYAKDGEFWVSRLLNFRTASGIEVSFDEEVTGKNSYVDTCTISTDNRIDFYEVKDNRLYFTYGTAMTDITEQCDDERYFKHEFLDPEGYRHILLVGGTPENAGSAEYILDSNGSCIFSDTSGKVPFGEIIIKPQSISISRDKDDVEVSTEAAFDDLKSNTGRTYSLIMDSDSSARHVYDIITDDNADPEADTPKWLENAERDLNILY